jgi:cytochrome bd-type quinol oxidase subunit 2
MTWAAGIFLPIVVAYQMWTYRVFARRIGATGPSREHGAVHSPAGSGPA